MGQPQLEMDLNIQRVGIMKKGKRILVNSTW